MKPNIFTLVVDAMSFSYMQDKYNTTPFITQLMAKSHNCTNVYSQGPYTEAALTPFYSGADNMDLGGNFYRGNGAEKTIFEAVSQRGYRVLTYTQPLIYPDAMHRGINEERYGVSYFFSAVYDYRLNYYKGLYESGEMTQQDFDLLYPLLESNFSFWLQYLTDCRDDSPKADFVNAYSDKSYDFDGNIARVQAQYDAYKQDPKAYIIELFTQGAEHPVFAIAKYDMDSKASNDYIYEVIAWKYQLFFEKLVRFNKEHNGKDSGLVALLPRLMKALAKGSKEGIYSALKQYYYYLKLCGTKKDLQQLMGKKSNFKAEPTILEYFSHFQNWLEGNQDDPFFCMMHISDLHTPEIFFSIDSNSLEAVEAELQVMNDYLDSLPADFRGNVVYNLSMRYVDLCVEKMYRWMEETGLLENTVFMLTADHGSSFRYHPIRQSIVNNDYVENYHIPFFVHWQGQIQPKEDDRFYTTKDISKTIVALARADDPVFTGTDVLSGEGACDYAITEYLGSGCPDLARRPLWLVIRDKRYTVAIRQKISQPFTPENILSVYDRQADPMEQRNLLGSVPYDEISYLHQALEQRFCSIQQQYRTQGNKE